MIPIRITQVIGTTSGGTGRHVAMLAVGGQALGLTVSVIGPAVARQQFSGVPVPYVPVDIGDRPRPVSDAAAILALRGGCGRRHLTSCTHMGCGPGRSRRSR